MNLQNLRVFLKVAELEHITRASEELSLSQPAVTKTIQSLEHEAHIALVERQGRRIVLTHAGRVLQGYARKIFALEREMEEALTVLREGEVGEVTLAANTTTGVYLLPPIVARFQERFPRVKLNIAILNSHEIIEGTLDWSLDFGLVEGDVAMLPPGLKVKPFAHDELILVVAPDHPWSRVALLDPAALAEETLLLREQGSGIREVIEHRLQHQGVYVRPLLTLTDNEAIKQMVMNGVGSAIVSSFTVQRELTSRTLVRVPLAELVMHPQLSLIMREDKQLSRAAQEFCASLFPASADEVYLEQL